MKIEYTTCPSHKDIDFLSEQLNLEAKEFSPLTPFAFFIREEAQQIKGGVNGLFFYGSIYIDQLWISPDRRVVFL